MVRSLFLAIVFFTFTPKARAEPTIVVDGFVDSYLAHGQPSPDGRARSYTTQALYQDEPYLNLASGGLALNSEFLRARVAAQWGSSVTANYSAEPNEAVQYIQEGFFGYKLSDEIWLDAGIFLSHIGPEGWLSKDNLAYTRSFIAEFSPYYESGVRLSGNLSDSFSGQLLLVRGWQNISQNSPPALGTLLTYNLTTSLALSHSTFLGDEGGTRVFNDLHLKWKPAADTEVIAAYDIGYQNTAGDPAVWSGASAVIRQQLCTGIAASFRAEYFSDHEGIVASSVARGRPFSVTGISAGIEYYPVKQLLLRAEYRPLIASSAIFPRDDGGTTRSHTVVLSVATWIHTGNIL